MESVLSHRVRRLGILGLGHTANKIQVWAFDYLLYSFVIWQLGLLWGGLVMAGLSAISCYATLRFYDWTKTDWLGIESLKQLRDGESTSRWARLTTWFLRRGDWASFLFLSIQFDPFITTAYMRLGSNEYNGLSARDWRTFAGSVILANGYWALAIFTGVSFLDLLWDRFIA